MANKVHVSIAKFSTDFNGFQHYIKMYGDSIPYIIIIIMNFVRGMDVVS